MNANLCYPKKVFNWGIGDYYFPTYAHHLFAKKFEVGCKIVSSRSPWQHNWLNNIAFLNDFSGRCNILRKRNIWEQLWSIFNLKNQKLKRNGNQYQLIIINNRCFVFDMFLFWTQILPRQCDSNWAWQPSDNNPYHIENPDWQRMSTLMS